MSKETPAVQTTAPLANVATCVRALERAINRPGHLPGLVAFYGPSGWGKTTAAAYAANHYRAYCIEAKSVWTRKALLNAILTEMGVAPAKAIPEMADQVAEHLVITRRPLIIDEFDKIVDKNYVEVVRDIYEGSSAPMLILGEERLEVNLRRYERFHNRILDWVPAQPASMEDARHLRALYCKRAKIADDLLARMHEAVRGNTRRICVNLERIQDFALAKGLEKIASADWGDREFYTGEAPRRKLT